MKTKILLLVPACIVWFAAQAQQKPQKHPVQDSVAETQFVVGTAGVGNSPAGIGFGFDYQILHDTTVSMSFVAPGPAPWLRIGLGPSLASKKNSRGGRANQNPFLRLSAIFGGKWYRWEIL
ncbi:hypothetical protein [Flavobacterium caeni]|uniref:Outer membrane protein beta-barrel domain-containing protein n=1 Tax=Flavobacterium caeni TaxID=490189 RepID=A0A1G5FCC4_9FLAO|nr:hypothetical protein [Flavobacterium caeni]SCY36827.1 hypothetical protein SAMN02927903_01248 [Flavobacterium caeni]